MCARRTSALPSEAVAFQGEQGRHGLGGLKAAPTQDRAACGLEADNAFLMKPKRCIDRQLRVPQWVAAGIEKVQ